MTDEWAIRDNDGRVEMLQSLTGLHNLGPSSTIDYSSTGSNDLNGTALLQVQDFTMNPSLRVFFYCLYFFVFAVGMVGNALVCYVVVRNKHMQTVTNVFIMNLALSDILLCVLGIPFTVLYLITLQNWVRKYNSNIF